MAERRRRRTATAVALVGAIAGGIACQKVIGIDGAITVEPAVSNACGMSLARSACQACLEQSCCTELHECGKDTACAAHETCMAGCGSDYACRARCSSDHLTGNAPDVPVLDTCAVRSCESACGISCGAVTTLATPDAAAACQDCIGAHACSATEACGQSVDCQAIARCASNCSTSDCQVACARLEDDAGAQFFSAVIAGGSACYVACDVGSNWACVGRVTHPFAKGPKIALTVTLVDSDQHAPIGGVTVKACNNGDQACTSPLVTGTTDASGVVKLALPDVQLPAFGFQGYLDITSPTIVPSLYFFSFALSEPDARISFQLLKTGSFADLTSLVNVPVDPTRGHVAVTARDCFLNTARDVVFDADGVDALTQERYVDGALLSNVATVTDRSGIVFFLNAPPTSIAVRATPRAIGRQSSKVSLFVRPGTISLADASPSG